MSDSEPLTAATEVPGEFLDVTGHQLRRKMNIQLVVSVAVLLVACGILAAIIWGDVELHQVNTGVASIRSRLSGASSAAVASLPPSITSAAAGLVQSPEKLSQLLALFGCPAGLSVPRKWVILGDSFLRGDDLPEGSTWHAVLAGLLGGSGVEIVMPPAGPLLQQLTWLASQDNGTKFSLWTTAREPMAVFVSYGFQELLASAVSSDPRAHTLPMLTAQVYALLRSDWLDSARNRLIVVVPGVAYSPVQFFLPSTRHTCTDPLAAAMYNSPSSLQTQSSIQQATVQSLLPYAIAAFTGETAARAQIVSVDSLTATSFTWSNSDDSEVAYAGDCFNLNAKGQNLLARYLKACLSGQQFELPASLNDK